MIRVSIKGNQQETTQALKEHGIEGANFHSMRSDGAACYWDVPDQYRKVLVEWSCKGGDYVHGFGFAVGTLLHHSN